MTTNSDYGASHCLEFGGYGDKTNWAPIVLSAGARRGHGTFGDDEGSEDARVLRVLGQVRTGGREPVDEGGEGLPGNRQAFEAGLGFPQSTVRLFDLGARSPARAQAVSSSRRARRRPPRDP
ncbi:hypothetical protein GCM10010302_32150 [Streptomyces polychromogenes]|uniref:Uncharacterized protein n=1 Tax=Streptomyces polychromogenes TaxID=67342 RepID=A0ABN0VDU4_9ACTN